MGTGDNYTYTASEAEGLLAQLKSSRDNMTNTFDGIKEVLKTRLLSAGMEGQVADTLLNTLDTQVITKIEEYLATADDFINKNTAVKEAFDENIQKTTSMAG